MCSPLRNNKQTNPVFFPFFYSQGYKLLQHCDLALLCYVFHNLGFLSLQLSTPHLTLTFSMSENDFFFFQEKYSTFINDLHWSVEKIVMNIKCGLWKEFSVIVEAEVPEK